MESNKLLVTVATYNEIGSLPTLVAALMWLLPEAAILVVDDDSPDGTGRWADQRATETNNIFCLHRFEDRGLGSATIDGFKWGLERGFDYIATLDADMSHDPKELEKMAALLGDHQDAGVVIGSRYVAGGGIQGWPMHRRLASRMVNGFAKFWLGLKTQDNTGAFRIYRSSQLRRVVDRVHCSGFGYLEEILFRFKSADIGMVEHPIVFKDRTQGDSKASVGVGLAVLKHIFKLRFENSNAKGPIADSQ